MPLLSTQITTDFITVSQMHNYFYNTLFLLLVGRDTGRRFLQVGRAIDFNQS